MADLTGEQQNTLKEIVLYYLQGEDLSVVGVRLQSECAEFKKNCKSLYKSVTLVNPQDDPFITAILGSLNIRKNADPTEKGPYEKLLENSNNLHTLLTHLYHDGNHHVGYLLQLIENTKHKKNWSVIFMLGAIGSALLGLLLFINKQYVEAARDWLVRTFPTFISWLGRSLILIRNIPLFGMIYTGIGLLWHWYQTFSNGTTTTTEKYNRLFFKTLAAGLTIGAYVLTYFTAGVMTIPAAMLLVLSSSTDVFQSVYNWHKNQRAIKMLAAPDDNAPWEVVAEYEKAKNSHQQALRTVWIKLGAAVLTTVAVAIWNLFPPNLIITVCCMTVISLIGLTKWSILSNVEETDARNLQKRIRNIERSLSEDISPSAQNSFKLYQKAKELEQREKELVAREKLLYLNEAALQHSKIAEHGLSSPAKILVQLHQKGHVPKATDTPMQPIEPSAAPPANNDDILHDPIEHELGWPAVEVR